MSVLLVLCGIVTLCIGLLHYTFPYLLDFDTAIPREGPALKEFNLLGVRHPTSRDDVRVVVNLMNHLISFTLVSIGIVDLTNHVWISNPLAPVILGWFALWWLLRLRYQTMFRTSRKSLALIVIFLLLAVIHGAAAFVTARLPAQDDMPTSAGGNTFGASTTVSATTISYRHVNATLNRSAAWAREGTGALS